MFQKLFRFISDVLLGKTERTTAKIVIAVDGHSSCGKSTLAKDLAVAIGYLYVDTGAMYRAITLKIMQTGIQLDDQVAIDSLLDNTDLKFKNIKGQDHIFLDGKDVESEIRKPDVAGFVSPVSEISSIRIFLVEIQRKYGKKKAVVMEGRDISTVVFPHAELKIFVTADLETRTKRRYQEMISLGINTTKEDVQKNLSERDHIDSSRDDSPLSIHPDAILIDTSNHSRESQLEEAIKITKAVIKRLS